MAENEQAQKISDRSERPRDVRELTKRYKSLEKKSRNYPSLIASRQALRLLPLLAKNGNFNYWLHKEQKAPLDNRAKALLAIYSYDQLVVKHAYGEAVGGREIRGSAYIAFDAANYSSVFGVYPDVGGAVSFAFSSQLSHAYLIKENLEQDIQLAETLSDITELAAFPLWQNGTPEEILQLYREQFTPAVKALIEETENSLTRAALAKMLSDYSALLVDAGPEKTVVASNESTPETANILHDRLNRKKLVSGLADILAYEKNTGHQTIGLLGHWGSGKSAVLNLLKQNLKHQHAEAHFLFGEFNAWAYEYAKNIQAAMAHEVIKSLTSFQGFTELREQPGGKRWLLAAGNGIKNLCWVLFVRSRLTLGFAIRKHPLRVLGLAGWLTLLFLLGLFTLDNLPKLPNLVASVSYEFLAALVGMLVAISRIPKDIRTLIAQPYTKELLTYVKLPRYAEHIGEVSEMRNDIRLMCDLRLRSGSADQHYWLGSALKKKRLFFVVDDLDRCGPEGIVKTFEAVRLILDIPQVSVVIAIDQRIALAALALHYKELQDYHALRDAKSIARDYLGKMIHYPVVLRDPDYQTSQGFMSSVWDDGDTETFNQWHKLLEAEQTTEKPVVEQKDKNAPEVKKPQDSDENITEAELAEVVIQLPSPEATIEEIIGLSAEQKASFVFWCNKFGIKNPRQLKRLHNSYNLLRKVRHSPDPQIDNDRPPAFGWLTCLLLLEFINNEESEQNRNAYRNYLREHISLQQCSKKAVLDEALAIIDKAAALESNIEGLTRLEARKKLLSFIDLFVLPAIDGSGAEAVIACSTDNPPPVEPVAE